MSENGNSIFRVPITRDSRWNHKNTLKYDQTRVTYCKYIAIYIYIYFFLSFFFLSPYLDNLDGDGKRRRTFSLEGRKEKKKGVESRVDSKLEEIEPVRFRCHIRRCEKKKKERMRRWPAKVLPPLSCSNETIDSTILSRFECVYLFSFSRCVVRIPSRYRSREESISKRCFLLLRK